MRYVTTLINKDDQLEVVHLNQNDLIPFLTHLDTNLYRVDSIVSYNTPVSFDWKQYLRKETSLELGKN